MLQDFLKKKTQNPNPHNSWLHEQEIVSLGYGVYYFPCLVLTLVMMAEIFLHWDGRLQNLLSAKLLHW